MASCCLSRRAPIGVVCSAYMCVITCTCMQYPRKPEGGSGSLEPELEVLVSCPVVAENRTWASYKSRMHSLDTEPSLQPRICLWVLVLLFLRVVGWV